MRIERENRQGLRFLFGEHLCALAEGAGFESERGTPTPGRDTAQSAFNRVVALSPRRPRTRKMTDNPASVRSFQLTCCKGANLTAEINAVKTSQKTPLLNASP